MPTSTALDRCYALPVLAAVFLLLAGFSLPSPAADSSQEQARAQIAAALSAMGGEAQLRAVKTMGWKAIGHRYMREQSERPTGPWLLDYFQISQIRDLEHRRLREERQSRGCNSTECWKSADWQSTTFVFADGAGAYLQGTKSQAAPPDAVHDASELLAFAPEQILLEALAASDLHVESSLSFHGFTHQVVSFHHSGAPVRILLNPVTSLPACVEITRPFPESVFWGPWGDVTTRFVWTFWQLEQGGLHYPRQWNIESNGRPDWTLTINELTLNPPVAADQLKIPDELAASLRNSRTIDQIPFGRPDRPPAELVTGIVQVPASWNVAEVRAADGIFVIEGPISNGYSARTIEDVQRRFPGSAIKGVITTSDAWPHIGGLREYAARGIPVYALDLNEPILRELFNAPYLTFPDDLAKNSRKPDLHLISKPTALGEGENRMELIPLRTQTGERQLFIYFPSRKLLYTSDLFQRDLSGAFFLPQTLSEAVDVVHREKLTVDTAFGMHLSPTPWKTIEDFVDGLLTAPAAK
jgi:hypothetical protein